MAFRIFAHRGAPKLAPENTIVALEAAAAAGAKWVECDLQLTKDNQVVIFHDETVDRTTNGRGSLSEMTYDQVAKLDAGSWFDPKFAGVRVPTLVAWLQCSASLEIAQNLELKVDTDQQAEMLAFLLVQNLKTYWPDKMSAPLISSSSFYALQCVAKASKNTLPLALISDEQISESKITELQQLGFFSVHHEYQCLNKKYVDLVHAHDLKVYAYTVNDEKEVTRLKDECGVDGVFVDAQVLYVL